MEEYQLIMWSHKWIWLILWQNPWGRNRCIKHWGKWELSQLKLKSDENPTFLIKDSVQKVHIGKNKTLVNSASTKFILSLPMVWESAR